MQGSNLLRVHAWVSQLWWVFPNLGPLIIRALGYHGHRKNW